MNALSKAFRRVVIGYLISPRNEGDSPIRVSNMFKC